MPHFASLWGLQQTDALAQRYGVRPSTLLGVSDAYMAYCVDVACALAGDAKERKAESASTGKAEPEPPPPTVRMVNGLPLIVGTLVKR